MKSTHEVGEVILHSDTGECFIVCRTTGGKPPLRISSIDRDLTIDLLEPGPAWVDLECV